MSKGGGIFKLKNDCIFKVKAVSTLLFMNQDYMLLTNTFHSLKF